jgi:hypothetical protein
MKYFRSENSDQWPRKIYRKNCFCFLNKNLNKYFAFKIKDLIQKRLGHHGEHHHLSPLEVDVAHRATMDFLPKPKGSWQELNNHRQRVYNTTLVLGVGVLVSAILGVIYF